MQQHSSSIKAWSEDDRPREKLALKGSGALSDAELLAIIIGSGSRDESAVALSRRILGSVNNDLVSLGKLGLTDLKKFKGMGEAKSITVMAAIELARRRRATEATSLSPVVTPAVAYEMMLQHLDNLEHEEFWLIALNRKCVSIGVKRISEGGMTATVVDLKKLFKLALDMSAERIIVAHNHPSGSRWPSEADNQITKKIKESGALLDCQLQDHIIVTDSGYYSYYEDNQLSLL
ncbi:MAG: DNA repair protein RadC [Flavobacteriales bacterium]